MHKISSIPRSRRNPPPRTPAPDADDPLLPNSLPRAASSARRARSSPFRSGRRRSAWATSRRTRTHHHAHPTLTACHNGAAARAGRETADRLDVHVGPRALMYGWSNGRLRRHAPTEPDLRVPGAPARRSPVAARARPARPRRALAPARGCCSSRRLDPPDIAWRAARCDRGVEAGRPSRCARPARGSPSRRAGRGRPRRGSSAGCARSRSRRWDPGGSP